jgi:hypothetical protein
MELGYPAVLRLSMLFSELFEQAAQEDNPAQAPLAVGEVKSALEWY